MLEEIALDGLININKCIGITSHDVVYRLRKLFDIKKIGHTGTLDPDASGVLPMCIGRATRIAEFCTSKNKEYRAVLRLGVVTNTQDISGEVLEQNEVVFDEAKIRAAAERFVGDINQIPPMYSAIKVGGKKLYELAREGVTIEREPRRVRIDDIEFLSFSPDKNEAEMYVKCSKGTYIRTLCHDIGAALGCGGCMSALERTASGKFRIEDSYTLEEVESMYADGNTDFLIPVDKVLEEYDSVVLAEPNAKRLVHGIHPIVYGLREGSRYRVYDEYGAFLSLARVTDGELVGEKNFFGDTNGKTTRK